MTHKTSSLKHIVLKKNSQVALIKVLKFAWNSAQKLDDDSDNNDNDDDDDDDDNNNNNNNNNDFLPSLLSGL
jgi:hypothetical protein